jgi:hypothetical protein
VKIVWQIKPFKGRRSQRKGACDSRFLIPGPAEEIASVVTHSENPVGKFRSMFSGRLGKSES